MRERGDLTIFQQLLPANLLDRELGDEWLKTPVFARTLERLRKAETTMVSLEHVSDLLH
jgi:hypothetical protein